MNQHLETAIETLSRDPRLTLAIVNERKTVCYFNGSIERRTALVYVGGRSVVNPGESIGAWRLKTGGRGSPTWLRHYDNNTTIIIPRTVSCALSLLCNRPVALVLLDTNTRHDRPHYWIRRETIEQLAEAGDRHGPAYWTRGLCRGLVGKIKPQERGVLMPVRRLPEPAKMVSEFDAIIDGHAGAPRYCHAIPRHVALKSAWLQEEPAFGLETDDKS